MFFELKNINKVNGNNSTSSDVPKIKPKSVWEPQKYHHAIKTFIEALNIDVDKPVKHIQTLPRNNISQHKKNIKSKLSKREDLVFTKADKGGGNPRCRRLYRKSL